MVIRWLRAFDATKSVLRSFHPSLPSRQAMAAVVVEQATKLAAAEHSTSHDTMADVSFDRLTQTSTSLTLERHELLMETINEDNEVVFKGSPRLLFWLQCTLPKVSATLYDDHNAAAPCNIDLLTYSYYLEIT